MTTKPPTAAGISRLLAATPGFQRSVSSTTRIKGWHDWNEGFEVEKGYSDGEVIVRHRMDKWARGDAATKRHDEQIRAYTEVLVKAGYTVTANADTVWPHLIVAVGD